MVRVTREASPSHHVRGTVAGMAQARRAIDALQFAGIEANDISLAGEGAAAAGGRQVRRSLIVLAVTALFSVLYANCHSTAPPAPPTPSPVPELRIVAVGDSIITAGIATESGWLNEFARRLSVDLRVIPSVQEFGENGAWSGRILEKIQTDGAMRRAIASADLIVIDAGINDFLFSRGPVLAGACGGIDGQDCLRRTVTAFDTNWDAILGEVHSLAPNTAIRVMDIYYSPVEIDEPNGLFPMFNSYLALMNEHINSGGAASGYLVAQIHLRFNGADGSGDPGAKGLILPDGIHPTAQGHTLIALALQRAGYGGVHVTSTAR